MSLTLLFFSSFLAATLVPGTSEVVLGTLVADSAYGPWTLVGVATLGNTLGSVVNWVLGRFLSAFADRKWFPLKPKQFERAHRWFARFGVWSLLLAWLPVIGDPLTVVAGLLRTGFWPFVALVGTGKLVRYAVVAGIISLGSG